MNALPDPRKGLDVLDDPAVVHQTRNLVLPAGPHPGQETTPIQTDHPLAFERRAALGVVVRIDGPQLLVERRGKRLQRSRARGRTPRATRGRPARAATCSTARPYIRSPRLPSGGTAAASARSALSTISSSPNTLIYCRVRPAKRIRQGFVEVNSTVSPIS